MAEIPEILPYPRDVLVWDRKQQEWFQAHLTNILVDQPLEELKWTNTGVATDVTPDTDKEIDIHYAQRVAIQIDSTHGSNTSTDIDINVEATLDGATWDTIPYAERNIGDAEIKTFLLEVSVQKIRLRLDNNNGATTAYVTARVLVVK
ncbi:hypothetical protein ES703_14233 [subsurface metagenome]